MKKFVLFAIVVFVVWYGAFRYTNGVQFTLKNVGAETLHTVTVEVTGKSYTLSDIPSGAAKTIKVNPVGESDIKLRFPGGSVMTIDCYLEHDYGGSIEANISSQGVVAVKDKSTLPSWF